MIEVDSIYIANPRKRDKFTHDEIKKNIHLIGLKRPISFRKIVHEHYRYALICGQGAWRHTSNTERKSSQPLLKMWTKKQAI